jgi:flagellar M-ring protein FliF
MVTSMKTDEENGIQASGVPGTASNLPRPTARPTAAGTGASHHTENITYQTSRTVRHTVLPQGSIKKISVSILVDHDVRWSGTGAKARRTISAPSPEKLKTIQEVIAGVVGLSTDRGDQVLVESLPFESTLNAEPPATTAPAPSSQYPQWLAPYANDPKILVVIVAGSLGLVSIAGLFLFMALRSKKPGGRAETRTAVAGSGEQPALLKPGASAEAIQHQMQEKLVAQEALQAQLDEAALSSLKLPSVTTKKSEVLVKHLRESVTKDTPGSANILRSWLTDSSGD